MLHGQSPRMVGSSVKRKEDPRLMMGEGKFTGDVQLKGMAHMSVLRSPPPTPASFASTPPKRYKTRRCWP